MAFVDWHSSRYKLGSSLVKSRDHTNIDWECMWSAWIGEGLVLPITFASTVLPGSCFDRVETLMSRAHLVPDTHWRVVSKRLGLMLIVNLSNTHTHINNQTNQQDHALLAITQTQKKKAHASHRIVMWAS